jgi:subtilisin-like proprotein convertase family protein
VNRKFFVVAAIAAVACVAVLPAGSATAKKKPKFVTKTFTNGVAGQFGGVATTIPDGAGQQPQLVRSQIPVKGFPKRGNIKDVNVGVRANHPFDDDLEFYLVTPRGVLNLSSDNGGNNANYGAGATSCGGTLTLFDSNSPIPITTPNTAPFVGAFAPEESLATLNGLGGKKVDNTTWTLIASDDKPADSGTLFCWSLTIKTTNPK